MAFRAITDSINQTSDKLQEYLESTAEYYKLRLFKSVMQFSTSLVNMLVIGFVSFLFLIFISIGGALYLNTVIGNPFAGFLIVGGIYLLFLLLVLIFGKGFIEKKMLVKFSDLLIEDDDFKLPRIEKENLIEEDELVEENTLDTLNEKPIV